MLVVIGSPAWRSSEPPVPAGRVCAIALAAADDGAAVELVGRVGDDPEGDRLLHALTRARVGHTAVLRDPARRTPVQADASLADDDDVLGSTGDGPVRAGALPGDSAAPALEAGDVELAMRYLPSFRVVVVADDVPEAVLPAAVAGASFAEASLVVVIPAGGRVPAVVPPGATVLEAPPTPDAGELASLVGRYAAALDRGMAPAEAFRSAAGTGGWSEAPDEDDDL